MSSESQCIFNPDDVVPFCTEENDYGITYSASTSRESTFPYAIGCINGQSTPGGAWFIMQIDEPGDLGITMSHSEDTDLDFIAFGPFEGKNKSEVLSYVCERNLALFYDNFSGVWTNTLLDRMAVNGCRVGDDANSPIVYDINDPCFRGRFDEYPTKSIVDCSSSKYSKELCYIPNAKHGEWYLLFISNWARIPGYINFQKTGGTGTTICSIIVDAFSTGPYCEGEDIELDVRNAPNGASFLWTGPNGFSSTKKNPVIPNATSKNAGDYKLVMYSMGYESPEATVPVVVYSRDTTVVQKAVSLKFGEYYEFEGKVFDETGKYEFPYRNVNGCDSLVILDLQVETILPEVKAPAPICVGESLTFEIENLAAGVLCSWKGPEDFSSSNPIVIINDVQYSQAGTYTATLSALGKEMKLLTEVKVLKTDTTVVDTTVQKYIGESFVYSGNTYSGSGTFQIDDKNAYGCDSITIINLTIDRILPKIVAPTSICEGEKLELSVEDAPIAADYTWTMPNENVIKKPNILVKKALLEHDGCYSVLLKVQDFDTTLYSVVEVLKNDTMVVDTSITKGETYSMNGEAYTMAGTYRVTLNNQNGCDSIVILNLKVMPLPPPDPIRPAIHFSPNGDGVNDLWQIENIELYPDAIVTIYDRWGKKLFQTEGYDNVTNAWNGKFKSSNCPSTDYWYVIDMDKIDRQVSGHFTLIRK